MSADATPRRWRLLLVGALALGPALAARAATFTVTTTADTGAGSLRQAITDANTNAGPDTIAFEIDDLFFQSIEPASPLPAITDPVFIDGFTQFGAFPNEEPDGNSAELAIILDGSSAGAGADGLHLAAGGCSVRGLNIINFNGAGIRVAGDGNAIAGNFIGVEANGFLAAANTVGIQIGSASNVVGGVTPESRNQISGNSNGVVIVGAGATGNLIQGNFIGPDKTGSFELTEDGTGIRIDNAPGNLVGGTEEGARNVISGNATGVLLLGTGCVSNRVEANQIGTAANGAVELANQVGVLVDGAAANTIGGENAAAGNRISGNSAVGVQFDGGAAGNALSANLIGVGAAESNRFALGNLLGVEILAATNTLVGGTTTNLANIVAANRSHGIRVGPGATDNRIQGNYIGTDERLTTGLGNEEDGIHILGWYTLVGGTAPGAGNLIAFNEANGITVTNNALYNTILANSIFTNDLLGIDLAGEGVTANDPGDLEAGPNHLQNYPVLSNASSCTGITLDGLLQSASNSEFVVEFFRNEGCDPSGFGEGRTLFAWTNLVTDAQGNAPFSLALTNEFQTGEFITSTATEAMYGNSSEFSACLEVDRVKALQVVRPADANCQAVVGLAELDGGTTDPCGGPVTLAVNPPGPYPLGTNLVIVTATAPGYTNDGVARVVVLDQTPPVFAGLADFIRTAGPFATNRVVFYDSPVVLDNCSSVTLSTAPPSGATFPLGTNVVACTATDAADNTTTGSFRLIVLPFGPVARDLAVVSIKGPKRITLKATQTTGLGKIKVAIQNRGQQDEVIASLTVLTNLVQLTAESLGFCPDVIAVLQPPKQFPIVLKSKKKLTLRYQALFGCPNDPALGLTHEDFSYRVTLNRAAIDGLPDGHPDDDECPRGPLPLGVDANPDGKTKDYGCGSRTANGLLGAPVLTDIVVR